MAKKARITRPVEFREGDGPNLTIPVGPCEIEETALDATIGWTEGDSPGSTAIPIDIYRSHLASGAIELVSEPGRQQVPAEPVR